MLFSFQIGIENDIHSEWNTATMSRIERRKMFVFKESVKQKQVRRAIDRN